MEGIPTSGPILCEKAVPLHKKCMVKIHISLEALAGSGGSVNDTGYAICLFKVKNCLQIGKEVNFLAYFSKFVEDHQLILNQIFNCDETVLNFCTLPDKTLAVTEGVRITEVPLYLQCELTLSSKLFHLGSDYIFTLHTSVTHHYTTCA